jgi:hypothetical protein
MKYSKPNFKREWNEAIRYPEFEEMGKKGWLDIAQNNFEITNYEAIKDVLGNVNLDFDSLEEDKKERFEVAFEKGVVEIPIVVKFNEDDYDLVGGNTRLAGLVKNGINPKLWVVKLDEESDSSNLLKGGNADNKSLIQIAKKHDAKGYYHIDNMVQSLKRQVAIGIPVEMEHTDDKDKAKEIVMDHLWEDPTYYTKLKKMETKEMTGADSAGAFSAPAFGGKKTVVNKIHNMNEEEELDEITDASSSGSYDVPLFGGTKGRKSPLSIGGPDTIYKGRAVKDKNFPKWGGPGGKFVKIKDKCKKYPYCTQGDMSALELLESEEIKIAIKETAKKYGLSHKEVNNLVLNQIKGIFI